MPLFKKVSLDSGSMLETHRRSLTRCRLAFLKDLDVSLVMEYMGSDEGFRQEQREMILACPTRDQRIAMFLDQLESRGERAFCLFMEALKARCKHLYTYLEETIRTVDEWDCCPNSEMATVNGIALRRLLAKRKLELASQNIEESQSAIEKVNDLQDDTSDYINCYSVTTKGHLQKEKWIRHFDTRKPDSEQRIEKLYMTVVCSNLIFRRIDWSAIRLPEGFKKPPRDSIPAYVFEKESNYMLPPTSRQTSHDVGESFTTGQRKSDRTEQGNQSDFIGSIPTASFRVRSSMPPPPVPPKPENLPILGLGGCPPLPKPRTSSDVLNVTPPLRTTSRILLPQGKVKPPVPKKKKVPTATLR